eukprot:TRINITY_DN15781_c0_g1_i1.p1 TRINITY_DN15781_c0_g1~~TRINITY_DN15781_c0_g1_i1.p1  ORF type:complete len:108 (+),score=12.19 TRINITY_DN15781_c0_g1_i1:84-407(+)
MSYEYLVIAFKMRIKATVYSTDEADFWGFLRVTPCSIVFAMKQNEMGMLTTPEKAQVLSRLDHMSYDIVGRQILQTAVCFPSKPHSNNRSLNGRISQPHHARNSNNC